ncbi:MAG: FadR/GntR family transcriptional regulator [Rikenellaceae bacterium]
MANNTKSTKHTIVNGSVAQQVTSIISKQIIDGKYSEGDFLPTEEELCEEFGIGRSSVREAIKTLESRGMVRKLQGKGVIVVDETIVATSQMLRIAFEYKKVSFKDLAEFRVSMEIKLAGLAAQNATSDDLREIKENLEQMKSKKISPKNFAAIDYKFHESIAQASGNNVSVLILRSLYPIIYDQITHTIARENSLERTYELHEKIYNAIEAKSSRDAEAAMSNHLRETLRLIDNIE